jgi:hypothetical protein
MLIATGMSFFSSIARATPTCDQIGKDPAKVTVNLTIPEVQYDFSKTKRQMTEEQQGMIQEWLQKQGVKSVGVAADLGKHLQVGGLTSGGYAFSSYYMMRAEHVDRYGVYYCPHLSDITVELFYRSIIFMPKGLDQKSCEFEEVMKHEYKHHTANVLAVQRISDRLEQDLPVIAREIELSVGYVDRSRVDEKFEDIKMAINDAIDIYFSTLSADSEARNDLIDTPEEYLRVERAIQTCEKESS